MVAMVTTGLSREGRTVTWEAFVEELWARFGPTDCEDYDEALLRVIQTGSLRDYQKEFERLGKMVQGWTQKALVGTFMGGLKPKISEGIWMLRPKTLKEPINLARMKDDQLSRQRRLLRYPYNNRTIASLSSNARAPLPGSIKKLSWDEMQRR